MWLLHGGVVAALRTSPATDDTVLEEQNQIRHLKALHSWIVSIEMLAILLRELTWPTSTDDLYKYQQITVSMCADILSKKISNFFVMTWLDVVDDARLRWITCTLAKHQEKRSQALQIDLIICDRSTHSPGHKAYLVPELPMTTGLYKFRDLTCAAFRNQDSNRVRLVLHRNGWAELCVNAVFNVCETYIIIAVVYFSLFFSISTKSYHHGCVLDFFSKLPGRLVETENTDMRP